MFDIGVLSTISPLVNLEYSSLNVKPLEDQPVLVQLINATIERMREGFSSVVHLWIDSADGGDRSATLRYKHLYTCMPY